MLPNDHNGDGIYAEMKAVRGCPGRFTYRAVDYSFPGYWLVTQGTW